MRPLHRLRLSCEAGLAVVFGASALSTIVSPTWLERVVGLSPDGGSGSTEWGLTLALGLASALSGAGLAVDRRRLARPATAGR